MFVISSMLTGGAVLRVAGRVFLGWGAAERQEDVQARQPREEQDEEDVARDRTPPLMVLVPAVLLLAAIVIGLIPGSCPGSRRAAAHFHDHAAYIALGAARGHARLPAGAHQPPGGFDYLYGAGAALGAVALAALALFGAAAARAAAARARAPLRAALTALRHLHSGHIGDYIAWWTAGAACWAARP